METNQNKSIERTATSVVIVWYAGLIIALACLTSCYSEKRVAKHRDVPCPTWTARGYYAPAR